MVLENVSIDSSSFLNLTDSTPKSLMKTMKHSF